MRLGHRIAGVRVQPELLHPWLESRYSSYSVPDIVPNVNFSLLVRSGPPGLSFQNDHRLYRGHCALVRTRVPWRAIYALDQALARLIEPRREHVTTNHLVVTRQDRAIILPKILLSRIEVIETEMNADGLRLADPPYAYLDVASRQAIVRPSAMIRDKENSVQSLDAVVGPSLGARPEPGRYRIVQMLMLAPDHGSQSVPIGRAFASAISALEIEDTDIQSAVAQLYAFMRQVPTRAIDYLRPNALLDVIKQALSGED